MPWPGILVARELGVPSVQSRVQFDDFGFEAFDLAEKRIRMASGLLGVGELVVEFRFDVEASSRHGQ